MNKDSKIYIAGHTGMVGSAIIRKLHEDGFNYLILKTHKELDLINQKEVALFFESEKPDYVFIAAAKVGGIMANNIFRGQFLYENLMIQNNLIHSAHENGVKKLLFLGSSCIYPKMAPQPIKEEYLLTDTLEETNEPYAIAKIAGIKMCESYYKQYGDNFISIMPTNLFGINDNFDLRSSHVVPALIRKFHEAKKTNQNKAEVWGSGSPRREFLYVDDLADACLYLMENLDADQLYDDFRITHINIGTGKDITIKELAEIIKRILGYKGELVFDTEMPDGTPQKLLDITRLTKIGWKYKISLEEGIKRSYNWYLSTES